MVLFDAPLPSTWMDHKEAPAVGDGAFVEGDGDLVAGDELGNIERGFGCCSALAHPPACVEDLLAVRLHYVPYDSHPHLGEGAPDKHSKRHGMHSTRHSR